MTFRSLQLTVPLKFTHLKNFSQNPPFTTLFQTTLKYLKGSPSTLVQA